MSASKMRACSAARSASCSRRISPSRSQSACCALDFAFSAASRLLRTLSRFCSALRSLLKRDEAASYSTSIIMSDRRLLLERLALGRLWSTS
jgi:hypothetical protein